MTDIQDKVTQGMLRSIELRIGTLQDLYIRTREILESLVKEVDGAQSGLDVDISNNMNRVTLLQNRVNVLEKHDKQNAEQTCLLSDRIDNVESRLDNCLDASKEFIDSHEFTQNLDIMKMQSDIQELQRKQSHIIKTIEFDEVKQSKVCIDLTNIEIEKRKIIAEQYNQIKANEETLRTQSSEIKAKAYKLDGLRTRYVNKQCELERLNDKCDAMQDVPQQIEKLSFLLSDVYQNQITPAEWERRITNYVQDMTS